MRNTNTQLQLDHILPCKRCCRGNLATEARARPTQHLLAITRSNTKPNCVEQSTPVSTITCQYPLCPCACSRLCARPPAAVPQPGRGVHLLLVQYHNMDLGVDPATLYAPGCQTDLTLVLQDSHGHTAYTFSAVRPILSAWSPVIKQALECDSHAPGPGGGIAAAAEDPLHHSCSSHHSELPLTITGSKEAEAWAVALCLMHPLSPTAGTSPASLITTTLLQPLVALADKYDMGGLLPVIKDVLLDPRAVWGVRSVSSGSFLDALEWLAVAERVPGFEPVVARCIKEVRNEHLCTRRKRNQHSSGTHIQQCTHCMRCSTQCTGTAQHVLSKHSCTMLARLLSVCSST